MTCSTRSRPATYPAASTARRRLKNLVANGIANILTTVQTLAAMGAEHFVVPNMPDLGTTPEGLGLPPANAAFLSALTNAFNVNLAGALTALDGACRPRSCNTTWRRC